jgi:replicative DNA helicase
MADLIIPKNRSGRTGLVRLAFKKGYTKFSDVADPETNF